MNNQPFTTKGGSVLPILNLKGKDYLEVKYRLVWFREEHPMWTIETKLIASNERMALFMATIKDDAGRVLATSHKQETASGFPDFIEKAETGSIGRALALIGYGTQFCGDELDEGERIVDSPSNRVGGLSKPAPALPKVEDPSDLGNYVINVGKKFAGKKLKDVSQEEIESFILWMEDKANQDGKSLSHSAQLLKQAAHTYFHGHKESPAYEPDVPY